MELVSRDRGKEVLRELVDSLDQLEKVATISDIFINPGFDSVLESRFVESLRRMGGVAGLPTVKLVQDIVNGKSGFVLELAGQRYRIEPQCNLGPTDGVVVASKPDFVIWPWQAGSTRKPVAVFCDGWTYHQDSLREDALKRSALLGSGKFWVWSVAHDDVKAALTGAAATDLESPLVTLNRHDGSSAPPGIPRAAQGAFAHHAVAQLLAWLAKPVGSDPALDAAVDQLQRNALWLTYLMVPPSPAEMTQAKADAAQWLQKLPGWVVPTDKAHVLAMNRDYSQPRVTCSWPLACANGSLGAATVPGLVALDDVAELTEEALHLQWRQWLALFNTLQFLPGMQMATMSGIDGGDCNSMVPPVPQSGAGAVSGDQVAWSQGWIDALRLVLEALGPGMKHLAAQGLSAPVVGHELADEHGDVIAEAELAWPNVALVVLTAGQADMATIWAAAGWRVMVLDDASQNAAGYGEWSAAVVQAMSELNAAAEAASK